MELVLAWDPLFMSRDSSQAKDQTQVSRIAGRFFTVWATTEALASPFYLNQKLFNLAFTILGDLVQLYLGPSFFSSPGIFYPIQLGLLTASHKDCADSVYPATIQNLHNF